MLVGGADQKFIVHKDMLIDRSTYFRTTIAEASEDVTLGYFRLPDIDPKLFRLFVECLYKDQVDLKESFSTSNLFKGGTRNQYEQLVEIYTVADQLGCVHMKNQVMSRMLALFKAKAMPSVTAISMAYMTGSESSTLRRFMVDVKLIAINMSQVNWLEQHRAALPNDFIFDFALALVKARGCESMQLPTQLPRCLYHEHDDEVPKCQ